MGPRGGVGGRGVEGVGGRWACGRGDEDGGPADVRDGAWCGAYDECFFACVYACGFFAYGSRLLQVPHDKPAEAQAMVSRWLAQKNL